MNTERLVSAVTGWVGKGIGGARSVLSIVGIGGERPYYTDSKGTIHRTRPKIRGKANVKRAKRARHAARIVEKPMQA